MLHRVMQESSRQHHAAPPSSVPQRPPLGSYTGSQWEGKEQTWVTEQILGAIFGSDAHPLCPHSMRDSSHVLTYVKSEVHFRSMPKMKPRGILWRTNQILPHDLRGSDKAFYVYKPLGYRVSFPPLSPPSLPLLFVYSLKGVAQSWVTTSIKGTSPYPAICAFHSTQIDHGKN